MDTEKDKTLEQIHIAIENVEKARAVPGLTPDQKYNLEIASVKLWMLEQSIIKKTGDELINSLTKDSEELKILAGKIRQSAESLKEIAGVLENIVNVVEVLIKVIGAVQGAGLV